MRFKSVVGIWLSFSLFVPTTNGCAGSNVAQQSRPEKNGCHCPLPIAKAAHTIWADEDEQSRRSVLGDRNLKASEIALAHWMYFKAAFKNDRVADTLTAESDSTDRGDVASVEEIRRQVPP